MLLMANGRGNIQASFEQQPPIPETFYVQQIKDAADGENNLILRVKYYDDPSLPEDINLFFGSTTLTLKDDGVFPDLEPGDFNYAVSYLEDIPAFIEHIQMLEETAKNQGGIYHFTGRNGNFILPDNIPLFEVEKFNGFNPVQVYQPILNVALCNEDLKKEKSLFITDLSVVEDEARTFNVVTGVGNPQGAWTFGTLMKNIANEPQTGVSTKEFLREWVSTWLVSHNHIDPAIDVSEVELVPRGAIVDHLIKPWLVKANPTVNITFNQTTWEDYWDATPESELLKYAPFRLMAIVNRLDLKSNASYGPSIANSGETRFIFTLIDPVTGDVPFGDARLQTNPANSINGGLLDWRGMNVILEYGNPFTNECDLKLFAQQWYDLSAHNFGPTTNDFNDNLELITKQVTDVGVGGTKNMNGSAINQIRTNERLFLEFGNTTPTGPWDVASWELRQFELGDGSHYLEPTVVSNTPIDELPQGGYSSYNHYQPNLAPNVSGQIYSPSLNGYSSNTSLIDWIYGPNGNSINKVRVMNENHIIPQNLLSMGAQVKFEISHYFNFNWTQLPASIYNGSTSDPTVHTPDLEAKTIRHNISLNTCQGCHAGENKTAFTMVRPQGYGQSAIYWNNGIPDGVTEPMDDRFVINNQNNGSTFDHYFNAATNGANPNIGNNYYNQDNDNSFYQAVSPFLTGRRYRNNNTLNDNPLGSPATTANPWDDDLFDGEGLIGQPANSQNLADDQLTGFFFVNDPSNESISIPSSAGLGAGEGGSFPQVHDKKWGFNDLQRRKIFLCNFIQTNCGTSSSGQTSTLSIISSLSFIPFAKGAH